MTPKRMIVVAAVLVATHVVLDVAGGRTATVALSGSVHGGGTLLLGVLYMLSYFATVLVAPPLVLTAAALAGLDVLRTGTKDDPQLR